MCGGYSCKVKKNWMHCCRPCWIGRLRESYGPLCPLDISPKCDDSAVEFGGELAIEIFL